MENLLFNIEEDVKKLTVCASARKDGVIGPG
jgi:hypothetical protein